MLASWEKNKVVDETSNEYRYEQWIKLRDIISHTKALYEFCFNTHEEELENVIS